MTVWQILNVAIIVGITYWYAFSRGKSWGYKEGLDECEGKWEIIVRESCNGVTKSTGTDEQWRQIDNHRVHR